MPQPKTILMWIPPNQIYDTQHDIRKKIQIYLHTNPDGKFKLLKNRNTSKAKIRVYNL
jgi:hypothetical protein